MQFDEEPVRGGGPRGVTRESTVEDFSALGLPQLFAHSNWKARRDGFERVWREPRQHKAVFIEHVPKACGESNAAAQEALLEALNAVAPLCDDAELQEWGGAAVTLAIEKGITGRPKAVQASQTLVSFLVENGKVALVFALLLPAFSHRTPKNRMAAVQLCAMLVGDFGLQFFPLKDILKKMQPLFNDASGQVRKETITLCCQCYMYMGSSMKGFLTDLREVQLQELEKQFEKVTLGRLPPKRIKGTSSSSISTTKAVAPIQGLTGQRGGTNDVDDAAFELLGESAVLSQLPRTFFPTALDRSASWQDRCTFVESTLLPLLSAPRLRASDDYHELATLMRMFLVDPQAPLMLLGFKMIQECARGLRASFAPHARGYLNALFEKMKDKKTSVLEHVMTTLEKLIRYHCVTLDQCQDEIQQASLSKNPTQRLAILHFCMRMMDKLESGQYTRLAKATEMLKHMVNDEKAANRETAYVLLHKLISIHGEAAYKPVIASMDAKQRSRMLAVVGNAESVRAPSVGPARPPPPSTPSSSPAKKLPRVEDDVVAATGPPASLLRVGKPPPGESGRDGDGATSLQVTPPRGTHPPLRSTGAHEDAVALESTLPHKDEASNTMLGLLRGNTAVMDLLRSREWSRRYEGVEKVREATELWSRSQCTTYLNTLVVFLRVDPGWREPIAQVFQAMLLTLQAAISRASVVSPGAAYAVVAGCTPRLTEAKNRQPVRDLCSLLVQRHTARFVMRHMMTVAVHVKTPKLIQECNEYFVELMNHCDDAPRADGGQALVDVKGTMEYLRQACVDVLSPSVRASCVHLLLALRRVMGHSIDAQARTLPPALRALFEQEVLRGGGALEDGEPPNGSATRGGSLGSTTGSHTPATAAAASNGGHPKRIRAVSQSPCGRAPSTRPGTASPSRPPPPPAPRHSSTRAASATATTISPRATARSSSTSEAPPSLRAIIREIKSEEDWRIRLEAVRKVEEFVEGCGGRLPANTVAPLLQALGSRFGEANRNLLVDVLRTVRVVVQASDPGDCRVALRKILPGAFPMLGDQKTSLRDEARGLVHLGVGVVGLEGLLGALQKPLSAESSVCRQSALEAVALGFHHLPAGAVLPRAGLRLLLPAIIRALLDRLSEVRAAAERVMGYVVPAMGVEEVLREVHQLKTADQQAVWPAVQRLTQAAEGRELPSGSGRGAAATAASPSPLLSRTPRRVLLGPAPGDEADAAEVPEGLHAARGASTAMRSLGASLGAASPDVSPGTSSRQAETVYAIQEIILGLRSATASVAYAMCTDFMRHLRAGEDCGTPEVMQVMVDRLYANTRSMNVDLALGLIGCLSAMFLSPRSAARCHSSLVFRLLGTIFDCLLSEQFSLHETVIKSLNGMTLKLLEGCPPNEVFSALLSRMTNYSTAYLQSRERSDLKYIQVTVKCVMRLDLEQVSPENTILCCHEYLLQHPPSSFRQLDDLPIRTVKTVLQAATKRSQGDLLTIADRLVGSQNLVTHFIRACLEITAATTGTRTAAATTTSAAPHPSKNANEQQAVEESRRQQRASHSPVPAKGRRGSAQFRSASTPHRHPPTHTDPRAPLAAGESMAPASSPSPIAVNDGGLGRTMAAIFTRIRDHVTSAQGIAELYAYLKGTPREHDGDFNVQFNRCSEAFRHYIKRKIEQKMAEDRTKPEAFQLPAVLRACP